MEQTPTTKKQKSRNKEVVIQGNPDKNEAELIRKIKEAARKSNGSSVINQERFIF